MLFYLSYTDHEVEKLHSLLVFFFTKIQQEKPTEFNKRHQFPEWYFDTENTLVKLEVNLNKFINNLDENTKNEIIESFHKANDIEYLFNNKINSNSSPIKIPIALDFPNHSEFLSELFTTLYSGQLSPKDSTFSKKIKNINLHDHYHKFKELSKIENRNFTLCPFCGIENLKMIDSEGRPDYDHLLPKGDSLFVFSSVNMRNLVPMGKHCNELKEARHLLYSDITRLNRSLAFYPYSSKTNPDPYTLYNFILTCTNYPSLHNEGAWSLNIDTTNLETDFVEKTSTWDRVFNIRNRYVEYISTKIDSLLTYVTESISPTATLASVRQNILTKINQDYRLDIRLIAHTEGLLPRRIFYEWLLTEQKFLSSFVEAKLSPLNNTTLIIDEHSSDYE